METPQPQKPWRLKNPEGTVRIIDGEIYLCLKSDWQIPIGEVLQIAFAKEHELHEEEVRLLEASLSKSWDIEVQLKARVEEMQEKLARALTLIKRLKGQ